jgi:hypothetical protein
MHYHVSLWHYTPKTISCQETRKLPQTLNDSSTTNPNGHPEPIDVKKLQKLPTQKLQDPRTKLPCKLSNVKMPPHNPFYEKHEDTSINSFKITHIHENSDDNFSTSTRNYQTETLEMLNQLNLQPPYKIGRPHSPFSFNSDAFSPLFAHITHSTKSTKTPPSTPLKSPTSMKIQTTIFQHQPGTTKPRPLKC